MNLEKQEIKFHQEDGYKMYRNGNMEFFAVKQGNEGYTLEVYEYVHVAHEYMLNRFISNIVRIPYEAPCKIDRIKERIIELINN
jgi:hypothetical protein